MKKIKLTKKQVALVDDSDYEELNRFKWHARKTVKTFYAERTFTIGNGKRKNVFMHRYIMQTPKGFDTDHIDGNGLNNQRSNLRVCTRSENLRNQGKKPNNTIVTGKP